MTYHIYLFKFCKYRTGWAQVLIYLIIYHIFFLGGGSGGWGWGMQMYNNNHENTVSDTNSNKSKLNKT